MTSISSLETVTPRSLSPLPTPTAKDLSTDERTRLTDETDDSIPRSKGKQKEEDIPLEEFDTSEADDSSTYPPAKEDKAETRRVEETLRRWEVAERQRRKQARDSEQSAQSMLGDISRRASLLWSGNNARMPQRPSNDLGNHVPLGSQENVTSAGLEDINASPTPTPSPSPSPSARSFAIPDSSSDPFANPPATPISPFADPSISSRNVTKSSLEVPPKSSLLRSPSSSSGSRAPPPRPLDLPPPRTPPPPVDIPPQPTSPPVVKGPREPQTPKETRWWHDWLCGCNEGPDRGGDYQAGRTNPFE